jgi:two-component system chemotaxis sensor kinase CheA
VTDHSLQLQRLFAKFLAADNVEARLARLIANLHDRDATFFADDIEFLGRFNGFFNSVDKSYIAYDQQTQIAFDNLDRSAAELNTANANLQNLNLAMTAMLNALEEGIFTFGPDGICSQTYSKSCLDLLEGTPANRPIFEVLRLSSEITEMVASLLGMLFTGTHPRIFIDDYLDLLPLGFKHSGGRSIALGYRPIFGPENKLTAILVIASDHTDEIEAINLSREREAGAMTVLRMSSNRNIFTRFFQSASLYFSVTVNTLSDYVPIENVRRDIHTLKGNASIFYLHRLVSLLHELETQLDKVSSIADARDILKAILPETREALNAVRREAASIFGEDFDRQGSMRTVPLDLLRSFAVELRNTGQNNSLANRFVSLLMGEPVRKQLAGFDIGLQELADRQGRKVNPCIFTGENFPLFTENYDALFSAFTHIARNVIAHAIDSDEQRTKWRKSPNLTVTIDTRRTERMGKEWFRLTFTDDGKGIDTVALRKKLKIAHSPAIIEAASEEEIAQYIFNDNLSTRDVVDELAGRGVGMGAVKSAAEDLGGSAYAESELHRFTRIIIEAPIVWS